MLNISTKRINNRTGKEEDAPWWSFIKGTGLITLGILVVVPLSLLLLYYVGWWFEILFDPPSE